MKRQLKPRAVLQVRTRRSITKPRNQPQSSLVRLGSERCLRPSDFKLWQLADSAFPTGGFAHSAGLEAAWQHGAVRNRGDLAGFLDASLRQLGRAALPYVNEVHKQPRCWNRLDQHCDAFMSNHVANRASRSQGKAFAVAVSKVFGVEFEAPNCCHLAPSFGAALRKLAVPLTQTQHLFVFTHLRGLLAAAVRLNIVGPMEAQWIQHQFTPRAETTIQRCKDYGLNDLAQIAPLLDLWQGAQDRLYSRLFQS